MTRHVVIASDGSVWPITGYWCAGCMLPMHPVIVAEGYETHPGCDPNEGPDQYLRFEEVSL